MKRQRTVLTLTAACTLMLVGWARVGRQQVIQSPELEHFLKDAPIVTMKAINTGVTHPHKATMELDGVTHAGIFKTIDEKPVIGSTQVEGGVEAEFQDSWRTEVAAYELDKLIGLGMVPTTVERTYQGTRGSMQFWVDSIMDEAKRQKDKIQPPDQSAWEDQVSTMRLWDSLIYNVDRNEGNVLISADWHLIAIDHSRTFRPFSQLKDPKLLTRFSRARLAAIRALTEPMLKARLDRYLTPFQIQGILKRRDAIVALAAKLVAQKGEAAVLYQ
jgi:hypothetical protein